MKTPNLAKTLALVAALALKLTSINFNSHAAAGDVDLSFNASLGITGAVQAVAVQTDGKVLAGGPITFVSGTNRHGTYQLNTNGSPDETFTATNFVPFVGDWGIPHDPVDFFTSSLTAFALQPDGKVLVAGVAVHWDCTSDEGCIYSADFFFVTRHYADGTRDTNFAPVLGNRIYGGGEIVRALAVEANGKILIGGYFHAINGTNRNGIARLNANGTLDTTSPLNLSSNYLFAVTGLATQPDGKFFLDGQRVNSDGSTDTSFSGVPGVSVVVPQADGKVLVGGNFTTVHGTNRNRIARLNSDGTLDTSFNPGTGADAIVRSIALQTNGAVVIGGDFRTVNGTNRNRVARLNANGSLDAGFDPEPSVNPAPTMLALQPDGKVLIGGPITAGDVWFGPANDWSAFVNGTNFNGRMRLNADGRVDRAFTSAPFAPPLNAMYHIEDCLGDPRFGCSQGAVATAILPESDGKVLIGGYSVSTITGDETFIEIYHPFVARLATGGGLQTSFDQLTNAYEVNALALQTDGRILVGGWFYRSNSTYGVTRLNGNGSVDSAFDLSSAPLNGIVYAIARQTDGKIIIGGSFTTVAGTNRLRIARLNSNGTLDHTFDPGGGANNAVRAIVLQPDGKMIIGGSFTTISGITRSGLARLNVNGSLDSSFNPGTGTDGVVRAIVLQPDGKVLIGGDFNTVDGLVRRYVARLHGEPAAPSMNVWRSNGLVTVIWPLTSGFVLDQSLTTTGIWSQVSYPYTTNGNSVSVSTAAPAGNKFFRLRKL